MSEPFIYIGTFTIKPDRVEGTRERARALAAMVEANEPQLIAFHLFIDEANGRGTVVQIHPDATSMEQHMKVVAEHLASAPDWMGAMLVQQSLGTPPPVLARYAREYSEPLDVFPTYAGGFTRGPA